MRLRFWKMSAAGNDFVLLAGAGRPERLARRLCDRRAGVGADGLLTVARAGQGVRMAYRNADGSVAFCGNGARCAAWWAFSQGWAGRRVHLATSRGRLTARVTGRERVALGMPDPRPLGPAGAVRVLGRSLLLRGWDTGAPQAVVPVSRLDGFPVAAVGEAVRRHKRFAPDGTNVVFLARAGRGLRIRTFERGVEDETWACGTGAVAAALTGQGLGWVRSPARVDVRGGTLVVRFRTEGGLVRGVEVEGPARIVFNGEVAL